MYIPEITSNLRKELIRVPAIISQHASGIKLFGKHIKSLIFSTDIAIIMNTDADAVIAVYPFTPLLGITKAITESASIPVLCGVGGGLTSGLRSANIALHAEFQGVSGVVLNAPASSETILQISRYVDIPIVVTVVSEYADIEEKLRAGASIVNVSGAKKTAYIVRKIRERYPQLPIIATGGPTDEFILETIQAGANAITYTPPTTAQLLKLRMEQYRSDEQDKFEKSTTL